MNSLRCSRGNRGTIGLNRMPRAARNSRGVSNLGKRLLMTDSTDFPIQLQFAFPPDPPLSPVLFTSSCDAAWTDYFRLADALAGFEAHLSALPSDRTPEQHTRKGYMAGLKAFLDFAGSRLPTEDLMRLYVKGLLKRVQPTTLASKYLAPVRIYLRILARQRIPGLTGAARDFVADCREELQRAAEIKAPATGYTTHEGALGRKDFVRLTVDQVNAVFAAIDRTRRAGLRDTALLYVFLTTGLRLAEVARITLRSIEPHEGLYLVRVRGKRNNIDPVPLAPDVYAHVLAWVEAFQRGLVKDDLRHINGDVPVWQPLSRTGGSLSVGANHYNPLIGMSHQAIRDVVARRTRILGEIYTCSVHDLRRTAAAIAASNGMDIIDISAMLRHANIATTARYIGKSRDYARQSLPTYVRFDVAAVTPAA